MSVHFRGDRGDGKGLCRQLDPLSMTDDASLVTCVKCALALSGTTPQLERAKAFEDAHGCPQCGAAVGAPCVYLRSRYPKPFVHKSRRAIAEALLLAREVSA